jgi:FkbM family methyltransferase
MTRNRRSPNAILGESAPEIRIVDVGALWLGENSQPYSALLQSGRAAVVGFEPILEKYESLTRMFGHQNHLYLPYAIGDGSRRRFHRCNFEMTSSLLEPDLKLMDLFCDLSTYCKIVSTEEIQTRRLDDIKEIEGVDYLKVDVQGAELEVLQSAPRLLKDTLVVQVEVEFVPLYCNQPLFAEVDRFLRGHGFMFHRFVDTESRALDLSDLNVGTVCPSGQLLWADAVYVVPITGWAKLCEKRLLKLAVILHEMYGSIDFCAKLLGMHDQRTGSNYLAQYLESD